MMDLSKAAEILGMIILAIGIPSLYRALFFSAGPSGPAVLWRAIRFHYMFVGPGVAVCGAVTLALDSTRDHAHLLTGLGLIGIGLFIIVGGRLFNRKWVS